MSAFSVRDAKLRVGRGVTALAILALAGGGAAWWSTPAPLSAQAPAVAAPVSGPAATSYADAVARVAPAVVTVRVEKKASFEPTSGQDDLLRRFFGDRTPSPQRM